MTRPALTTDQLAALDHAHLWHPFTPMRQWCQADPLIIERGEGCFLIDTHGKRYIDGVSSLWCNVHGHRHPQIDAAIRTQLDQIAHTTLLGLSSPPAIELAAQLIQRVQRAFNRADHPGAARLASIQNPKSKIQNLTRCFYTDAGATALEVAFKMAVGYWHHTGRPQKRRFIGLREAYHGDTAAAMSVGFSPLFHQPFLSMLFNVTSFANPDACRLSARLGRLSGHVFPSQDASLATALLDHCLADLKRILDAQAHETAAIVLEPIMQGAAGMIPQPPGFLRGVAKLAQDYDVLLIADEVATGFGRTGTLLACEQELHPRDDSDDFRGGPDILCLAKGITGGYLPLAATLTTDRIFAAFTGELHEKKTLYHGHTYTGNALACAAALASLQLFTDDLLAHIRQSAALIADRLAPLADHPNVLDVRQRGLMVGIELCQDRNTSGGEPFDFSKRTAANLCLSLRDKGLIIRPLGDVMVLMPAPAMPHDVLSDMLDIVTKALGAWRFT
jgi:adenosylmethionine-8-amino-7-oxononanoate aminotransferase